LEQICRCPETTYRISIGRALKRLLPCTPKVFDRLADVIAATIVTHQFAQVIIQSLGEYRFQRLSGTLVQKLAALDQQRVITVKGNADTVIDGEIVALDEGGKPSFNLLQGFGSASAIVLYAFDLLMLRGKDVRGWRLDDRREELRRLIRRLPNTSPIRYSESFDVPLSDLVRNGKRTSA
jgi:hypothetical protein